LCVRGIDLVSFCDFAVGYRISVVFLVFHFIQTLCIFCKEFMFYLCYLYLFTYTGVQHDFHIRWSYYLTSITYATIYPVLLMPLFFRYYLCHYDVMVRVFASLIQKYVRKDLKTTKGAIRTRKSKKLQYNTMTKWKMTKGQTTIYKTSSNRSPLKPR
jgi:signal transduction histidine kinase